MGYLLNVIQRYIKPHKLLCAWGEGGIPFTKLILLTGKSGLVCGSSLDSQSRTMSGGTKKTFLSIEYHNDIHL
jgi:hypothetical protein